MARLLVVDDSLDNLAVVLGMLEDLHEIRFATSAAQAREQIASGYVPDLLLLDMMMPDEDGLQFLGSLQRARAGSDVAAPPVVFLTANPDPELEASALRAGAEDLLRKPLHPGVLRARIDRCLARTRRP